MIENKQLAEENMKMKEIKEENKQLVKKCEELAKENNDLKEEKVLLEDMILEAKELAMLVEVCILKVLFLLLHYN